MTVEERFDNLQNDIFWMFFWGFWWIFGIIFVVTWATLYLLFRRPKDKR